MDATLRPGARGALPAIAVLCVLFGCALAGTGWRSLQPQSLVRDGAPSLDAWRALLADGAFWDALRFTLQYTIVATVLSAALALALAALLRRAGHAATLLAAAPVPIPHLVVATLAVVWLAPGGLADRLLGSLPLQLIGDRGGVGIVLVYVYKEVPFLTLLVLAAWTPGVAEREEAAAVLGAGPLTRLRHVIWPSVRPALAIGSLVVAAFLLGALEVPLVVGSTTPTALSQYALEATRTVEPIGQAQAAAALLIAAALASLLALVLARLIGRADA